MSLSSFSLISSAALGSGPCAVTWPVLGAVAVHLSGDGRFARVADLRRLARWIGLPCVVLVFPGCVVLWCWSDRCPRRVLVSRSAALGARWLPAPSCSLFA